MPKFESSKKELEKNVLDNHMRNVSKLYVERCGYNRKDILIDIHRYKQNNFFVVIENSCYKLISKTLLGSTRPTNRKNKAYVKSYLFLIPIFLVHFYTFFLTFLADIKNKYF